MRVSIYSIISKILRNHFKIANNWISYGDNRIAVLIVAIFAGITLLPFSHYLNNQNSLEYQVISILLPLIFPIYATKYYIKYTTKENSLFLTFLDKKRIVFIKQILTHIFSLSVFLLILLLGVVPHLNGIPTFILIIIEVTILLIVNSILPFTVEGKYFYSKGIRSNRFWDIKISAKKMLPIRGILIREFIYFWRGNKLGIIKLVFLTLLINAILILFIVNNKMDEFFIWAIFIQYIILLQFILQYSSSNNIELLKFAPCNSVSILIAEFIFWSIIITVQLMLVIIIYAFALTQIDILLVVQSLIFFLILLAYILLVRLAYKENNFLKSLIYYLMFIPVTIPYFIFSSYRRLKC